MALSRRQGIGIQSLTVGWLVTVSQFPRLIHASTSTVRTTVLIVLLWVDDLIIAGNNLTEISKFKAAISKRFEMKDLGELTWILGMEVRRDRTQGVLEITQKAYIDQMLKRYRMSDCKPVSTPVEGYLPRVENAGPSRDFMCLVGSLLYTATISRPDIAYAVQALGRHMQNSTEEHYLAGKRILRYLQDKVPVSLRSEARLTTWYAQVTGRGD